MNIQINDDNYHLARLDNKDKNYSLNILGKLIKKYPELGKYIKDVFKANNILIKKLSDNELLINILSSFLHSLKDNNDITNEEQLLKVLKRYVRTFLEQIFYNKKQFISSHPVQYEPKVTCILSVSNFVNREVSEKFDKDIDKSKSEEYEIYGAIEFINAFRTLKSSMLLFTIGDDVHAIALYRGFIEIYSKLMLIKDFKENYVKYKKYNAYLQSYKTTGTPLPQEIIDDLGDNVKNENFIAYGWIKNKNGRRITTLTELTKLGFKDSKLAGFLHQSGEFIHEDYVGVGYDYMALRKSYIDVYFNLTKALITIF